MRTRKGYSHDANVKRCMSSAEPRLSQVNMSAENLLESSTEQWLRCQPLKNSKVHKNRKMEIIDSLFLSNN
jgi:hypothetical protein